MNVKVILGFAVGPLASAVLGLVTVPAMAWVFSPEDVGRLSLLQVVLSFSLLLLVLGLDQSYVREFHASQERSILLKGCFAPGFLLVMFLALPTAMFGAELSQLLFGQGDLVYWLLILICAIANHISRFLSLILRMEERGLAYSMSQVTPKALQLVLLGALVFFNTTRNFLAFLLISVASALTVVVVYAWNTRRHWIPALNARISLAQVYSHLKFGLPFAFSGLAYWGLTSTSALMLRSQSSLTELGIYSVANSVASAVTIFQSVFTVVWAPTVYKWVADGADMARVDAVARYALAVVCVIFVLVGGFSWVIDYLLPDHYIGVKYLVPCAIAPPILYALSEITSIGIGVSRRAIWALLTTLGALCANLLLGLWLIPRFGAAGAVMANTVAFFVFFAARTEASAYLWRRFPRFEIYLFVVLACAIALMSVSIGLNVPFDFSLIWLAFLLFSFVQLRAEFLSIFIFVRGLFHGLR